MGYQNNRNNNKRKFTNNRPQKDSIFKQEFRGNKELFDKLDINGKANLAYKVLRDIAYGNIDYSSLDIQYFYDPELINQCMIQARSTYTQSALISTAVSEYVHVHSQMIDSGAINVADVEATLTNHSNKANCNLILLNSLNNFVMTGDIGWIQHATNNIKPARLSRYV